MLRPGKHYVNSNIRLTAALGNDACTLVDPELVQVRFSSPDGRWFGPFVYGEHPEIDRSEPGHYFVDFTPDAPGRWGFRWETADVGATYDVAEEGDFLVQASRFFWPTRRRY